MWNKNDSGKFRHIHAHFNIVIDNQTYSGIIQAYSEPCETLAQKNLGISRTRSIIRDVVYIESSILRTRGIFRTLVCSESWQIQNLGIFWTPGYSEPETCSELYQTSMMNCFEKIVKGYNYFCNISFSSSPFYEINIMNFLNTGLIFTPEVFILC